MLTFLVGSHVPLNNLYRLGRNKPDASSAQRPRPVLLTFSSPIYGLKDGAFLYAQAKVSLGFTYVLI